MTEQQRETRLVKPVKSSGGMNGMKNLIPFDKMPPERHRELSAKGGQASGEARRRARYLREVAATSLMMADAVFDLKDDIKAFRRWQKRRNEAKAKRD